MKKKAKAEPSDTSSSGTESSTLSINHSTHSDVLTESDFNLFDANHTSQDAL